MIASIRRISNSVTRRDELLNIKDLCAGEQTKSVGFGEDRLDRSCVYVCVVPQQLTALGSQPR